MRKIKQEEDLLPALKTNILADLDQLYEKTLQQVLSGGDTARSFVIHLFSWLLYMKSPLTLSTLIAAMSASKASSTIIDPMQVSDMCAHLVVADTKQDAVRFAHQSIEEYLLRNKQDLFSPCMSHGLLASTCIEVCSRGPPDGQPLEVRILSIYVYAAMYWATHFNGAEVLEGNNELFMRMISFVVDEDDMMPSLSFEIWMDTAAELASILPSYHPQKPVLGAISNEQSSPIFLAAVFGVDGLLKLLAESNIEIDWNQRNKRGHTAVYLAAAFGHASTLSILISQGGEVNVECGRHGSPLHAACYGGHEEVVKRLLSHNASVTCGKIYKNALDASAHGGNENIAIILVQSGTIKTDADYEHALQAATEFGFISFLAELQKPTFKSFRQNDRIDKQKARMTRAIKGGQLGVLTKVLSGVPDPSTLIEANAVAIAASYGHNDIIRFLLGIGMGIEAEGEFGTPLRSACLMGRKSTVQLLIEQGAGINSSSLENDFLHAAASKGHAAIVKMLVQEGADVDQRGGTFGSALHAAAYNGYKEVVQILLDAGARVQTGCYFDVFHAAVEGGHQDIVLFLLKKGYDFNGPIPSERYAKASRAEPRLPTENLFKHASKQTSVGRHHSSHCTEPKYPEIGSILLNPSKAAGQTSATRLLLDHRKYLKIGEDDILGMVKASAAHGHVDVLKTLVEWLKQQGSIERYHLPIFESAGEDKSHDTMKFALSLASHNGITTEEIKQMVFNWPPSPEKYDICVVDKNQLKRDFMRACTSGDKDGVSSILECRYRALLDHEDFTKAIELAAEAGHEPLLSTLFHHMQLHGLCLHEPLVSNASFVSAAKKGHLKLLKLLLSRSDDSMGDSQLLGQLAYLACKEGHPDIVKYLVEGLKVDANRTVAGDSLGSDALNDRGRNFIRNVYGSSGSRSNGMVGTTIEDVVDSKPSAGEEKPETRRFISLLQSSLRAFEKLNLFRGPFIPIMSKEESLRRTEVVTFLLTNGANPSCLGGQDAFPIQVAARLCPATIVRKLIDAGADVMCAHDGESALDAAIERDSGSTNIVRMILECGGTFPVDLEKGKFLIERSLKFFDRYGRYIWDHDSRLTLKPCLDDAFENGPGAVLELLLHQYPEYKTDHEIFICVLQMVCLIGKQDLVELLLTRGADPNRSGYYYGTPIQAAARSGQLEIVRLLLRHGASVNAVQGRWDTALRAASIGGHSDVVNLLISHGAEISLKGDGEGSSHSDDKNKAASALQLAVASGDMDTVNAVLEAGADVDENVSCSSRPRFGQEHHVNLEITSLKSGALLDVSAKPRFPYANMADPMEDYIRSLGRLPRNLAVGTALLLAVQENNLHMTRRLLAAGAQINSTSTGRNALLEAIEKGAEPSIVREPLAKGAMAAGSNYPTRLNMACDGKRVDLIELLLESIYDNHDQPEAIVDEALTALVLQDQPDDATLKLLLEYLPLTQERLAKVCFSGSVSNVLFMLDAGMSVHGEENEHHPIHLASRWLLDEVVQILFQRGANIHSKSPKWGTPLLCALSSCAEPYFKAFQSESALSTPLPSEDRGEPQQRIWRFHSTPVANIQDVIQCRVIVQLLVDNGADPNIDDCAFGKPLHIACLIGSTDIVTMLLDTGADVNAINGYFGTPLFAAMHGEHPDVVSLLLEHGAGVNYVHQAHGTPLHFACAIDDGAMTRRLLQHGASAAMLNQAGQTTLTLALKGHRQYQYRTDSTHLYRSSLYSLVQEAPQSVQPSEHDILEAARISVDSGPLASLLEINKDILVSEDLIVRLIQTERLPNKDCLRLLLERSGGLGITEHMLMVGPCLDTWTVLFQNFPVCEISPTILENQRDLGSFEFLLNIAENVDITEGVVLKAIDLSRFYPWRRSTTSVLATIWERKPSIVVTQSMLKTAMVTSVLDFLLRHFGPANGMLQDVAFSIVGRRDSLINDAADMLCLLLRHDLQIKLSSEMVGKVMRCANDCTTLESFLTHEPGLAITEELFLETFGSRRMGHPGMMAAFAEILRRHGKKVNFTQKMRDAIDSANIDMQTKKMFYDLSGGEETEEKVEAERRAEDDKKTG